MTHYDAVTLDTNIFKAHGLKLSTGLLAQLSQFQDRTVQFVLSEVVVKELRRHLVNELSDIKTKVESACRQACVHAMCDEAQTNAVLATLQNPTQQAGVLIDQFLESVGAEIVPTGAAKIEDVMAQYFETQPPFQDKKDKKHEFPDAIALAGLATWANKHSKSLLVVTKDDGWKAYADKAAWMNVEQDLGTAMQLLQTNPGVARRIVRDFLSRLHGGKEPASVAKIEDAIADALKRIKVAVGATTTTMFWAAENPQLWYRSSEMQIINSEPRFDVIRSEGTEISFRIFFTIRSLAETSIRLWLPKANGRQSDVGYIFPQKQHTFTGEVLVTIAGVDGSPYPKLTVQDVILLNTSVEVYFGSFSIDDEDDDSIYDDSVDESPGNRPGATLWDYPHLREKLEAGGDLDAGRTRSAKATKPTAD